MAGIEPFYSNDKYLGKTQVTHFYRFDPFLSCVEIAESYAHPLINEFIFLYPKE